MSVETRAEAVRTLMNAQGELQALARTTESGIESVARAFEGLASQADAILALAAAIVRCVENESISSVMPNVQTLGAAAMRFIGDRLQVTSAVLEMVTQEVDLLRDLSVVTRGQLAIALETRALSLLTNIEVSRLGAAGDSFEYLAQELAAFSKSVTQDTLELTNHTDIRRAAMEETQRALTTELPRQRQEMARIQVELGNAFAAMDSSLTQLFRTPTELRTCVEEVAQRITGVVAAVQAHDITRQQMDHVEEASGLISAGLREAVSGSDDFTPELAAAYAGLTIQAYQLRAVKQTVARWTSQIRTCMGDILRVSASEVVAIGPLVREHEDKLSFHPAHIEKLQRESQAYGERRRRSLEGVSHLMQLVNEHLQRSNSVRGHLQLLTFNSIIEASRLRTQAVAMLAIAESLKGVSAEWTRITHQSERARDKGENLTRQTNDVMEAFSETVDNKLMEVTGGDKPYAEMRHDEAMAALYRRNSEALGRSFPNLGEWETRPTGSTDMGNVSLAMPSIHPMIGINSLPAVNHQPEFAAHCITDAADKALADGALAMAWTCINLARDRETCNRLTTK